MKRPCDEKKQRKIALFQILFYVSKLFFCYWDIRQFLLTSILLTKRVRRPYFKLRTAFFLNSVYGVSGKTGP